MKSPMKFRLYVFAIFLILPLITHAASNSLLANIYCSTLGSWFGDSSCTQEIENTTTVPPEQETIPGVLLESESSTLIKPNTQVVNNYITNPTVVERLIEKAVEPVDMSNYVTKDFFKKQIESTQESSVDSISSSISGSTVIDDRISTYLSGNSVPTLTASSILPSTVGSRVGTVVTNVVTSTDSLYNDSQKWIIVGEDNFSRFVYFDNDYTDLHFVQCTNIDCTTKNDTIIASEADTLSNPTLVMGEDGYVRITYVTYNDPNEVHYIRCTNDSCSTKVDSVIDTADSLGLDYFYISSISIGPDGFARIVYDNYEGSPGTVSHLRLATCNDDDCTAPTLTTLVTSGNYLESNASAVGSDGFSRIAYVDYSTSPDELHYIQCTNATCTTNTNTTIDTGSSFYYLDMVLGSDGFGRIVYSEDNEVLFTQCTNASCSTSVNTSILNQGSDGGGTMSIVIGNDGLPRVSVAGGYPDYDSVLYFQCTNASCSTKNTNTIDNDDSSYITSIALGSDGYPRIIYLDYSDTRLYIARLQSSDGGSTVSGSTLGTSASPYGNIFGTKINSQELWSIGDSVKALHIEDSSGNEILNVDSLNGEVTISNLIFSATTTIGNKKIYSVDRIVESAAGSTVTLGYITADGQGNHLFNVYLVDGTSGGSGSKVYNFARNYSDTASGWVELLPTLSTGPRGVSDIVVDVSFSGGANPVYLRLRDKIGGSSAVSSSRIVIETYSSSIFAESSTSGTGGTVTGLLTRASPLTQVSGSVGIGTSSPQSRLELTQAANTSAGGFRMTSTDGDYRAMFMGTTGILSFTGGDGGTINTATLNAAGAWTNASDIAYKENIVNLDTKYSLADLMKIEPRYYTMKGSDKAQIGFIAQELKPILPEVVEGEEGSMGISYGNMVALLVGGVKEIAKMVYGFGEQFTTKKLCVGETCITEEEFKILLQNQNIKPVEFTAVEVSNKISSTTVEIQTELSTTTVETEIPKVEEVVTEQAEIVIEEKEEIKEEVPDNEDMVEAEEKIEEKVIDEVVEEEIPASI